MPTIRHRSSAGLLALTLVVSGLAVGLAPAPVRAAETAPSEIHSVRPVPAGLAEPGPTKLTAWVRTTSSMRAQWFVLDGVVLSATVVDADPDLGTQISADVTLTAGVHEVTATATTNGGQLSRTWAVDAVEAMTVTRIEGEDRFATAVAVSQARYPSTRSAVSAVIARSDDYADALAGVPFALAVDGPLLLATTDGLPEATATELRRSVPAGATVHLLGGEAALSTQVAVDVAALGYRVGRIAGADRYETAAQVADVMPASSRAFVVSGRTWPDALSASPVAGRDGVPILLSRTDDLPVATMQALSRRRVTHVDVIGGESVVGPNAAQQAEAIAGDVRRIHGEDRYATAAAVQRVFFDIVSSASIANGTSYPDALVGTQHAAALGQPLLLTRADDLASATGSTLAHIAAKDVTVYGGEAAVWPQVVAQARAAAAQDVDAAQVISIRAGLDDPTPLLERVEIAFDRPIDADASVVHLEIGGVEVVGSVEESGVTHILTFVPRDGDPQREEERIHDGRITVRAVGTDGTASLGDRTFSYRESSRVYAQINGIDLVLPSAYVELIGYHESGHDGAQQAEITSAILPSLTLPSRDRGTGSRTAADIVASPDHQVLAPASGTVKRAGSYTLYCEHRDHYLVIEPDGLPGWEIKILHFTGLSAFKGERVVGGETVIGTGPRLLPFASQVDEYSEDRDWPHLHVEVVDTSIPDRPSGGGC